MTYFKRLKPKCVMFCMSLFVLMLYVPISNFLVMLGSFPVLLGSNQNYVADKVSCPIAQQGDMGTHFFSGKSII